MQVYKSQFLEFTGIMRYINYHSFPFAVNPSVLLALFCNCQHSTAALKIKIKLSEWRNGNKQFNNDMIPYHPLDQNKLLHAVQVSITSFES